MVVVQDYEGEPGDPRAGRDYFKRRFARLAQKANAKEREIYIQFVAFPLSRFNPNMFQHHHRYRHCNAESCHGCRRR